MSYPVQTLGGSTNSSISQQAVADQINALIAAGKISSNAVITPAPSSVFEVGGSLDTVYQIPSNTPTTIFGDSGTTPINVIMSDNSSLSVKDASNEQPRPHFDIVVGGGNNTVSLNKGPTEVFSTTGNDKIKSGGGHDSIYGGSGSDTITAGGHSVVVGGSGPDTIIGGLKPGAHDTIYAGTGGDTIVVRFGDNAIVGGKGADYIQAGNGHDTVLGGTGHETIYGGGSTYIQAGAHNEIHSTGSDSVFGGTGPDTIFSTNGSQMIKGGTGHLDINVAKTANDTIFGGTHHDLVHVNQSSADITATSVENNITTLTFASGQVLQVQNVTLTFNDHTTKHV